MPPQADRLKSSLEAFFILVYNVPWGVLLSFTPVITQVERHTLVQLGCAQALCPARPPKAAQVSQLRSSAAVVDVNILCRTTGGCKRTLTAGFLLTVAFFSPASTLQGGSAETATRRENWSKMHSQTSLGSPSCLQPPAGTCSGVNFHAIKATYSFFLCSSISFLPLLNF